MKRPAAGVLVLVIGPSGAGKAALIEEVRRRRGGDERLVFPRRVISGPPDGDGPELHQTVTPAQFAELARNGVFGLVWGSGGRNYALPATIAVALQQGRSVLAAAAPGALAGAVQRYRRVVAALYGTGAADERAMSRALQRCADVIRLDDDPDSAAAALLSCIDDSAGTPVPSRVGIGSVAERPLV